MPLAALDALLEKKQGGLYFLDAGAEAKAVKKAAKSAGFDYFHIEGRNISRKEQLMNAMATALDLPPHFGQNWDALEECLNDLEAEGDGFVIHFDHMDALAAAHPSELETLVEILRATRPPSRAGSRPASPAPTGAPRQARPCGRSG